MWAGCTLHADAYRCGNLNAGQHGQAKAPAEPGRGFKGLPEVVQIDVVPDQRYGDGHRQRQSCLDIKESDRIPQRPVTGADVDDADGEAQLSEEDLESADLVLTLDSNLAEKVKEN